MTTTLTIKLNFGTSRPFLRYRWEGGEWQLSNTFQVESGQGPYQFSAIDSLGCIARITIKESALDFPDGNGTLTISKTVTDGDSGDDAVFFQFSVDGPVSFENLLVSADEPMVLENLPFGTYTVKENDPPSGYLNNDESKQVTLSDSNTSDGTAFVNEIDPDGVPTGPGSITINKVVTNEEPTFGDAEFRVNVVGPNIYYGLPVTIDTPQVLSDIPVGTYNIEEVSLPEGFFLNAVTPDNPELTTGNPDWTVKIFNTFGKENTGPGRMTINKKVLKTKDEDTQDVEDFSVLETGLAVDQSLHGSLSGVSMDLLEAGSPVNIHLSGEESWEQGGMTQGWGSIIEDHEGNLRVYYGLREIDGVVGNHAPCLSKSTDGGETFQKVRQNLNPTILNSSQSNIIKIPSPDGVADSKIINLSVYYDPYGKKSERYKATHSWNGVDGVWASASEDGLTFGKPVKIMEPNIGDGAYTGMFYDLRTKKYVMYGRGRFSGHAPADGPPKPYGSRRYIVRAESLNWNDTPWGTFDVVSLDPADEWNYDDSADDPSFWQEVSNACGETYEPVAGGMVRPNIYRGNAWGYKGYDIGIFPVFFQDDNRVPYNRSDRTTGPIYPVMAYKKPGGNWEFPDNDKSFIDLSIYERTETNPCHTAEGVEEVGQVNSAMFFDKHNGKFFTGALNRLPTHYEGGDLTDFDSDLMRMDVFSMREDGFARIKGTGTWTTPNFVLNELTASMILNSAGQVDVEILDSGGSVIANFAKADFSTVTADNVDNACSWTGTLANLAGQTIALKFYLDSASVYSYSFVAGDVDQNDELFTGDLQGEITIEGLQFSANDPAEIQNLPLGTYLFEEDEKSGWLLKSIDPLETTLTETQPEGEVLVTNEFGGGDPNLGGDEVWLTHNDGAEIVLYQAKFSDTAFTSVVQSKNVGNLGTTYDTTDDLVLLPNGNVVSFIVDSSDIQYLTFFDSSFNQLAQHTFDASATNQLLFTSRNISIDEDSNVYVLYKLGEFDSFVNKYDSQGTFIWKSGDIGSWNTSRINALVCGIDVVFALNDNTPDNSRLSVLDKSDGSIIYTNSGWVIDISERTYMTLLDNDRLLVFDSAAGSIVSPNPDPRFIIVDDAGTILETILGSAITGFDAVENDGPGQYIEAYPIDTTDDVIYMIVRTGITPNVWELRRVNLTSKQVEGVADITEDVNLSQVHTINFTDNNEDIVIGHYGDDSDTARPGLTIVNKSSMTVTGQFIANNAALGLSNGYMPTLHKRNWQLEHFESTPPPPTGTATITVNKTIQDGLAADDDKEFTVNVYGPANFTNQKVTANSPLTLSNLPFGEYTIIEEDTYPGTFEQVSITPETFTLKDGDASQTVEIVNRKMDASEEFVSGTLNIEDILSAPATTDAFTEIEIQNTNATPTSGSITVKYKGVNVTLVYDQYMDADAVALALASEVNNDGSIELTASVPSSRILRLTEKTSGAAGNSSQTGETVAVSFTNGTHISTPTDIFTLQGGSDPQPNFIEIYYPWDGDGFSLYPISPKVNMLYSTGDTRAEVAEALKVATNAADINLTATRSATSVTFTEKRAGPDYAGNVIRVITNGQTIQITPANGKITMT